MDKTIYLIPYTITDLKTLILYTTLKQNANNILAE